MHSNLKTRRNIKIQNRQFPTKLFTYRHIKARILKYKSIKSGSPVG